MDRFPYGLPEDWNQYDEGEHTIYMVAPDDVPVEQAARVIYELRQDVQRLNDEVMTLRAGRQAEAEMERQMRFLVAVSDAVLGELEGQDWFNALTLDERDALLDDAAHAALALTLRVKP